LPKTDEPAHPGSLTNRRQFLIAAGATVAGLAVGVNGWQALGERRKLVALPPPSPDAPNVLLIVLDTVRAQSLGLYGYQRPTTPFLEQFAKSGARFDRAISPAPWTLPAHASMFTGRFPHQLFSGWWQPLDTTYPTLAEELARHGYLTAGFVANTLYCSYQHGLNRGFAHYEDYRVSTGEIIRSSKMGRTFFEYSRLLTGYHEILGRKTAPMVNREFLRWLPGRDQQRPFFAFLNYFDAHAPYLPPAEFAMKFSTKRRPRGHLGDTEYSGQEIKELNDAYDGTVAYLDYHLGMLFAELERRDLLENTLVIITSDHGEQFGEHGLMDHGNSLYLPVLLVPLLISFRSRIPAGRVVLEPITLRDLPATVLDIVGLDTASFPGESLARHWIETRNASRQETEIVFSEVAHNPEFEDQSPVTKGRMRSLLSERMHYIKNDGDGREELYDFRTDPLEERNLAKSEEGHRLLERFRTSLETIPSR
jgi:arylsulfatase A-like enzyme